MPDCRKYRHHSCYRRGNSLSLLTSVDSITSQATLSISCEITCEEGTYAVVYGEEGEEFEMQFVSL